MTEHKAPTSNIGTRAKLRDWLQGVHSLSYTKYSKLPTELKLKIQASYRIP